MYILMLLIILIIICYLIMVYHARSSGRTFHEDLMTSMYGSTFPEEHFRPIIHPEQYQQLVDAGSNLAKSETLIIGGLAYNISKNQIDMLERRLDYVSQGWSNVKFFIYGLDSKEPYRSHLIDWANRDSRLTLIPPVVTPWKGKPVFVKMANLRTALHSHVISYIEAQPNPNDHYFLSIDCDLGGPISLEGLYHSRALMDSDPSIGAVYSNGIVSDSFINTIPGLRGWCYPGLGFTYYDDLALIIDNDDETKLWKWFYATRGRGADPIPVQSAYGGAALISYSALKDGKFDTSTKQCEHHSFNLSLKEHGYKLVVNPSFILLAGCQGHHKTRKL